MRWLFYSTLILGAVLVTFAENEIQIKKTPEMKHANTGTKEYITINGEEFYFGFGVENLVGWDEAHDTCASLGMQLLTMENEDRYIMLRYWIWENREYDQWYWTSACKPAGETDFTWTTTGNKVNYFYWQTSEPSDNPGADNCLNFCVAYGGWASDSRYGPSLMYICEHTTSVK